MRMLNLGVLAHVDAGKTSLTERLLYAAGVIDAVGSVDDGSTQTDSLALERERGITIKSAVVSFVRDGVTINLIDTPGHPDFIAEVERVLNLLDGVVLVISAVEGVQAQTRVLMRALQRLSIPTLIFVNKIDRRGARDADVLREIEERLTPAIVPMASVSRLGTREATVQPCLFTETACAGRLLSLLAERDDALLSAFVDGGEAIPVRRLRRALGSQTRRGLIHPVFCGSAITGAGVEHLLDSIAHLLPAPRADPSGPVSGSVFKIERGTSGEKIAYLRMFSGTVRVRDRIPVRNGLLQKVTGLALFSDGQVIASDAVCAGRIGKVWGLSAVRIGDTLGVGHDSQRERQFAPPTLESAIVPALPRERGAVLAALTQMAEQDPLINVRQDDIRREVYVSLYGEVQKEVIQATLAADYGLEVMFHDTTTVHIERPNGVGSAIEIIHETPNPFLATVGLQVEPQPAGAGVQFQLAGEVLGTMPLAFFKTVEETVRETLQEGLSGWQVTDCLVTLTHTGYAPRQSHAHQRFNKSMSSTGADFRGLTPLVVMSALRAAGTTVHEPLHRFRLEMPSDVFGVVAPVLGRLRASVLAQDVRGASTVLEGDLPAANVHLLQQQLAGLTRGEGVLDAAFSRYAPVVGAAPTRPRTDRNPLDRKAYLLNVSRRR